MIQTPRDAAGLVPAAVERARLPAAQNMQSGSVGSKPCCKGAGGPYGLYFLSGVGTSTDEPPAGTIEVDIIIMLSCRSWKTCCWSKVCDSSGDLILVFVSSHALPKPESAADADSVSESIARMPSRIR